MQLNTAQFKVNMEDAITKAYSLTQKYAISPKVIEGQQIRIDSNSPDGFSFWLISYKSEYVLFFGNWHQPYDNQDEALSAFEKCLSGEAHVRDVTCLSIPCWGSLEILTPNTQSPQIRYGMGSIFGLILFLFPKKEKIYRNSFEQTS